jgi:tRNA A-37 threonylcarbamoyl transferase component Bud32
MAELDPGFPERCGPYRIIRRIGSGAMASIFEAEDTQLGRQAAIKRLHPHVAERPGATERFLREGKAAARITHPHVVQVFALGEQDGTPYLAMELLKGSDLGVALATRGRLPLTQALEIVLPVIAGVAAAHDAGVIHRDLKPSNVFIVQGPGGRVRPKIVDFGVSKMVGNDDAIMQSSAGAALGTLAYMAPEQAQSSARASAWSDQYSIAVLLYQCVSGRLPFAWQGVTDLIRSIMSAPVPAPSATFSDIPEALDEVILRAMSRKAADRFDSLRTFGQALLAFAPEPLRLEHQRELEAPTGNPRYSPGLPVSAEISVEPLQGTEFEVVKEEAEFRAPGYEFAVLTRCTIVVWRHPVVNELDRYLRLLEHAHKRFGSRTSFISVCPVDHVLPDAAFVRAVTEAMGDVMRFAPHSAVVIEGNGVLQVMARAIHRTLFTVSRQAGRVLVAKTLLEAMEVLGPRVQVEESIWHREVRRFPMLATRIDRALARAGPRHAPQLSRSDGLP